MDSDKVFLYAIIAAIITVWRHHETQDGDFVFRFLFIFIGGMVLTELIRGV